MDVELKPLEEQVMVVTGGSSGIGLSIARAAARKGARVVIASRSKSDLKKAVARIRKDGGEAAFVVADVGDPEAVEAIADTALREFGAIDSWVNNAGVFIYGMLEEVPLEDARQLFDTNYWGVVHGSLVAARHLRERGGAIINVGSVVSDLSIPLQGHYAASKHAVKGFTDALRVELAREDAPVSVTLVKPSSIATPFPEHARNYMEEEPTLPPPLYDPRVVARAVLHCAEHPKREITVGGGGRMLTAMRRATPRLFDRYAKTALYRQQKTDEPKRPRKDNLFGPIKTGARERGEIDRHVMRTSAYTRARLHPLQAVLAAGLLAAGAVMALRRGEPRAEGAPEW